MMAIRILSFLPAFSLAAATFGQSATNTAAASVQVQPAPSLASVVDREISAIERQVLDVGEAMPEDKFNFTPESLNIPGANYKGVRTFAVELKHVAASNYFIWSALTGEKVPEAIKDGNGPENLKSKAEIIQFLKESFALGHRGAATLTTENMLQNPGPSKSTRLRLATFGVAHAFDHYGQMVEYLRMNGIVPPASRQQSKLTASDSSGLGILPQQTRALPPTRSIEQDLFVVRQRMASDALAARFASRPVAGKKPSSCRQESKRCGRRRRRFPLS